MNKTEIDELKRKLLRLRFELKDREDEAASEELDQAGIGSRSRMDVLLAQQRDLAGIKQRKRQLQRIEGALRRIEAGEYGKCFVCEEEIDTMRLSEDPTVTRCPKCVEE